MRKKKDEILVNYEGEPFYNLTTGEWLIDFEPELKKEFIELLDRPYDSGKDALCVLAERNMTYRVCRSFAYINTSDFGYSHAQRMLDNHKIYHSHPYTVGDMRFLYYKMAQLLTKHEELSPKVAGRIMTVADSYMLFEGIDLIEEFGDIFNYKVDYLEGLWEQHWQNHYTLFFRINKIFKTKFMRNLVYRYLVRLHWFDQVLG